ncbi:MAG: hypothetical protein KBC12_00290 [Candidatus Pacebacteria bacterium]|nr:hypothetical protein [Candidatus Paceibacterota bacterium]MBP9851091.1 hypothetical protein [Candidatus Paceibacterota bacterium]
MQVTDLLPLTPFLLGFLTQEELLAKQKQIAQRRKTIFLLVLFGLGLGLFLFIQNQNSKPPHEQPDYAHEKPDLEHVTKPEKLLCDWQIQIREGVVTAKLSNPPGGPGGEQFDDERFWRQRLEQLIKYIIELREAGKLYELASLFELNEWILKEIFAICGRWGIPLHDVLVRALGEDYVLHVVFTQTDPGYIDADVVIGKPGADPRKIIDSFAQIAGRAIGLLKITAEGSRLAFEEFVVVGRITKSAWEGLVDGIEKFLLPPPNIPGGPINPN